MGRFGIFVVVSLYRSGEGISNYINDNSFVRISLTVWALLRWKHDKMEVASKLRNYGKRIYGTMELRE